jgi:hypothetical protein
MLKLPTRHPRCVKRSRTLAQRFTMTLLIPVLFFRAESAFLRVRHSSPSLRVFDAADVVNTVGVSIGAERDPTPR